jgi:DnaJ-class molecular chaperone
MARHALAQEGDYFHVLGVDRQADATEIRRAHQRLMRECSPEILGPELNHELKELVDMIREVIDEALRILSTPALRAAYESNLAPDPETQVAQAESSAEPAPEAPGG